MLQSGTVLVDRICIVRPIGKGGMGQVYLARDLDDGTPWAVKEQQLTPKNREFLRNEARIQSRLSHPALPRVRNVLETDDKLYLVMEYVAGETLQQMIDRQGRFPEQRVLRWVGQLAGILAYLHGLPQPIAYRDLKPTNIIISPNDTVRLIDFGIAEEYRTPRPGRRLLALTRGFAAPEQYSADFGADVRTDLYALGATAHYLLTGKDPRKPPFRFDPVRRLNPAVSLATEALVKRCLQPSPARRFQSAQQLLYALNDLPNAERRLRRARRRRIGLGIGSAACMVVLLAGVFFATSLGRRSQVEQYYQLLEQADDALLGGDADASRSLLRQAIRQQPDVPDAYIRQARTYLAEGDTAACLDYIQTELLDQFDNLYENPDFLRLMADFYLSQQMYEDALYYCETLSQADPEDMDALYDLTLCQTRLGMDEAAENTQRLRQAGVPEEKLAQLQP